MAAPDQKPNDNSSKPVERERGTLKDTLPQSTSIIGIFWVSCVAVSAFVLHLTYQDTSIYSEWLDLCMLALISGLGAASAIMGIIYSDSSVHALFFGLTVLISPVLMAFMMDMDMDKVMPEALKVASPPLIVALLSIISPLQGLFSLVSKHDIIHPVSIFTTGSIPLASVLLGCIQLISKSNNSAGESGIILNLPIHPGATLFLGFASLTLFLLYIQNRSHKHGNLTIDSKKKGASVASFLAILVSTYMASLSSSTYTATFTLLVGSLTATLLAASFASVADVWYPVGTGQFQMISLDTGAILVYFVAPLVVLYFRFLEKYGEFCEGKLLSMVSFASSAGIIPINTTNDIEETTMTSLFILLGFVTAVGLPLLNSLCPLGGHVYGRLYTNGQPNTKRIALCVDFADLFDNTTSMTGRKDLWESLRNDKKESEETGSLNVFVTSEDIKQNASVIKELIDAGHYVGIGSLNEGSTIDIFRWNGVKNSLKKSFEEYAKLTGSNPSWYHVGHTSTEGVHPASFHAAYKHGMRVALWSTHINVTRTTGLSDADVATIRDGVNQHRGGNFIYLTASKRSRGDGSVAVALRQVITDIQSIEAKDGYVFAPMSAVAKENPSMDLS